ncbi:MAG: exodeoxyribonuclease VII large subunit [Oscillospiraceae bacterium]|nr:exodeoxyribonuclease VII large subunit [Oscillospiraceae bacterium]
MYSKTYTVTELNSYIKRVLDADNALAGLYVKGELSNYKIYPSGHHYFTMKDADSSLKCVMFKGSSMKLRFLPKSGMSIVACGKVQVFPRDGLYQLYVSDMIPDGIGELYLAYEQLKEKLQSEGIFDERHKKPLPRFPGKIAVITSPAGAAVQDILRILKKRWPLAGVIVMPVRVQGVEAPQEIAKAIREANETKQADIIITGRGGGSIEDLWAFNDEKVARAIFASDIPIISAVGHEPDVTIADFVADVRAATPSNAAEIAVPDMMEIYGKLLSANIRLRQAAAGRLKIYRQRLCDMSGKRVLQNPGNYINDKRIGLDRGTEKLIAAMQWKVAESKKRFLSAAASLDAMSPLKVLGRGYAIARHADSDTVIKSANDVTKGDKIKVRLQKDEISCVAL